MIINIDVAHLQLRLPWLLADTIFPPEKNDEGNDSYFKECKQTDAPEVIFKSSESVGIVRFRLK
jgi:hypothetical protein